MTSYLKGLVEAILMVILGHQANQVGLEMISSSCSRQLRPKCRRPRRGGKNMARKVKRQRARRAQKAVQPQVKKEDRDVLWVLFSSLNQVCQMELAAQRKEALYRQQQQNRKLMLAAKVAKKNMAAMKVAEANAEVAFARDMIATMSVETNEQRMARLQATYGVSSYKELDAKKAAKVAKVDLGPKSWDQLMVQTTMNSTPRLVLCLDGQKRWMEIC